jgi:hypothetical protein
MIITSRGVDTCLHASQSSAWGDTSINDPRLLFSRCETRFYCTSQLLTFYRRIKPQRGDAFNTVGLSAPCQTFADRVRIGLGESSWRRLI